MKNKKGSKNDKQSMSYLPSGLCIGLSIGVGIGALANNIPAYMCMGLSIGLAVGASIDSRNRRKEEAAKKDAEDEATEEDYRNSLESLGVDFDA